MLRFAYKRLGIKTVGNNQYWKVASFLHNPFKRETGDSNSPKTAICRWHIAFPSAHTGESLYFCRRQKCKRVPDGSPSQAVKKDATPKKPGKAWVFWLSRAKKMQGFSADAQAHFYAFLHLNPGPPAFLWKSRTDSEWILPAFLLRLFFRPKA